MFEDRLAVWQFKQGDADALRRIYDRYIDLMLSIAANLLGDFNLAEDAVQEVFISFAQSIDKFQLRGSLKNYLAKCVVNKSRDILRKQNRQKENRLDDSFDIASPAKSPPQLIIKNELTEKMQNAISRLSYEQKEAVICRLHGQMKFRQIADIQQVSVKTVISRYRYGIDRLRSMLKSEVKNGTDR